MNPDLVVRDEEGKVGTVRYEAVNAMPLKEFLKTAPESRGSRGSAAETGGGNYAATEADRTLTATVRKVSERVELSAPAPPIVANED